jgi:glutamate/aspartate transport system ATP-binding protein
MITLKNVSKWYGHFQVLTDCSTEVKKGEVVVVCGPSGSGKSTLIKTVNGLEPVQKGEIIVNGTTVNDKKPIWPNCVLMSGWCSSISNCSRICRSLRT